MTEGRRLDRLPAVVAGLIVAITAVMPAVAPAQGDLDFWEYSALVRAANTFDHVTMIVPPEGGGAYRMVIADRWGVIHVYELTHGAGTEIWRSRNLDGNVSDLQVGDLDGNGWDEIIAVTEAGRIYVWEGRDHHLLFENLSGEFTQIHSFTLGNVDDDDAWEIIVNADRLIYYIDGINFTRDWTSVDQYEAPRMRCGDVDGDGRNELVLATGEVIDSRSGSLEWDEEPFGNRLILIDFDGDGIVEVLGENEGQALRVFDMDAGREQRFQ